MNIKFVDLNQKRSTLSCNECRRRKKRCDELKPSCTACMKRSVGCVYSSDKVDKQTKKKKTGIKINSYQIKEKVLDLAKEKELNDKSIQEVETISSDSPKHLQQQQQQVLQKSSNLEMFLQSFHKESTLDSHLINNHGFSLKNGSTTLQLNDLNPQSISPLFQMNLDNISLSPLFGSTQDFSNINLPENFFMESNIPKLSLNQPLDLDLEFVANSILSSFDESVLTAYKFKKCYKILFSLTKKSKAVLFCTVAFVLMMNDDNRFEQFLLEARRHLSDLKLTVNTQFQEDDLINYIVCLTCQSLIGSCVGDLLLWRQCFEDIYEILNELGLNEVLKMLQKEENKNAFTWVVHWFFYQDVLKMVKVLSNKKIGPVFSKFEYRQVLKDSFPQSDVKEDIEMTSREAVDPSFACSIKLYIILGEINSLYDQFVQKLKLPINHYYKTIKTTIQNLKTEEERIEFLNSAEYFAYEDVRMEFHDWVQKNTQELEKKISLVEPETANLKHLPLEDFRNVIALFGLMKRSVLLYLKVKIKELSTPSYEIKQVMLHILRDTRELIGTNLNDYLFFPFLICGASVCEYRDRLMVKSNYLKLMKHTKCRSNLEQIWKIIQEFWNVNPNGYTFEMWQNVINKLDWNICII